MNASAQVRLRALLPLAAAVMSACTAINPKPDVAEATQALRRGPESGPQRSITNFSDALRCMDTTLINYGVRDLSVLVEDITDQTRKVNAGTKDMLISAVSDMTRRSRAIRLVAFGNDSGNVIRFLWQAERKSPYAVVPQYDIRGSITQLDETVARKQNQVGIGIDPHLNIGAARSAASSILGLDLTVLTTHDLSVVPGVTSRNSVAIFKEGTGVDGDATIRKFSINYSMALARSEGQAQALRNLVELATVELFGKLTKTPYWSCLGVDSKTPEIDNEISDWYSSMYSNPAEFVAWFQKQLRQRGYYTGPVDGVPTPELRDAVAAYRKALGLAPEPKLDLEFFRAYLNADHARVMAAHPPPPPAATVVPPRPSGEGAPKALPPLALSVAPLGSTGRYARGEQVRLAVRPSRDAHVYCYLQDENRQVQRLFPNRFSPDSLVRANAPLQLPGAMRFQLLASAKGKRESVACYATDRDVLPELSPTIAGVDFESVAVGSLDQVRDAFAKVSADKMGEGVFHVDVR